MKIHSLGFWVYQHSRNWSFRRCSSTWIAKYCQALHRTCTNQKSIRFRAVLLATWLEEYLQRVILVISGSRSITVKIVLMVQWKNLARSIPAHSRKIEAKLFQQSFQFVPWIPCLHKQYDSRCMIASEPFCQTALVKAMIWKTCAASTTLTFGARPVLWLLVAVFATAEECLGGWFEDLVYVA